MSQALAKGMKTSWLVDINPRGHVGMMCDVIVCRTNLLESSRLPHVSLPPAFAHHVRPSLVRRSRNDQSNRSRPRSTDCPLDSPAREFEFETRTCYRKLSWQITTLWSFCTSAMYPRAFIDRHHQTHNMASLRRLRIRKTNNTMTVPSWNLTVSFSLHSPLNFPAIYSPPFL